MKRAILLVVLAGLAVGFGSRRLSLPAEAVRAPASEAAVSTAIERGRVVYARYGCAMCHGPEGEGGVANPNAETDGQVPGVIYVAEGYTEDELRRVLLDGAPRIGKADAAGPTPPYRMPGFAGHMSEPEVDALVQYLMSLYPKSAKESWR